MRSDGAHLCASAVPCGEQAHLQRRNSPPGSPGSRDLGNSKSTDLRVPYPPLLCHCSSLARACDRPQPFPMSMCGVAAKSDCLTFCLSACSCSFMPRMATFTLGASASTNRNIAREDVVQKHHQTAARCRRLLAGEPRHPWFVTKVEFSAAPEAPWGM